MLGREVYDETPKERSVALCVTIEPAVDGFGASGYGSQIHVCCGVMKLSGAGQKGTIVICKGRFLWMCEN